jgi:hypothetical protein
MIYHTKYPRLTSSLVPNLVCHLTQAPLANFSYISSFFFLEVSSTTLTMSLHPSLFRITHADDEAIADAVVEGYPLGKINRLYHLYVEPQALRAWSKELQFLLTDLTVKGDTADSTETGVKPLVRPGDISGIKVVSEDGQLAARAIWKYAVGLTHAATTPLNGGCQAL